MSGRPLAEPRQLDGAVHGDGRRAGAALRAEERPASSPASVAMRRFAPRRRAADRVVERLARRRPGEELVGAGAHRLQDQIRSRVLRDDEDAGVGRGDPDAFDRLHRRRGSAVNDDDIG